MKKSCGAIRARRPRASSPFVRTGGSRVTFATREEPHEKGGIEGEAGYFRRNHWVPVPKAHDLADLNTQLLAHCRADEGRQIAGHQQPVGALMIEERAQLLPARPKKASSWRSRVSTRWRSRLRRVRTNLYSVPAASRQDGRGPALSELRRSAG